MPNLLPPSLTKPFEVTEQGLLTQLKRAAAKEGVILNDSPYSPFWTLVTRLLLKPLTAFANTLTKEVLPNSFVMTATGAALDLKAEAMGVLRIAARATAGQVVLERANGTGTLQVPIGLRIHSTRHSQGNVYELLTTELAQFAEGETTTRVDVLATQAGVGSALGAGQYVVLPDQPAGIMAVNNPEDWISEDGGGRDLETDDSLRQRMVEAVEGMGNFTYSHYTALIAKWAKVKPADVYPGEQAQDEDNNPIPCSRVFHYLLPTGNPTESQTNALTTKLNQSGHRGDGDIIQIKPLQEQAITLQASVVLDPNIPDGEHDGIKKMIADIVRAAFRQSPDSYVEVPRTEPGVEYPLIDLIAAIAREEPRIATLNFTPNRIAPTRLFLPTLQSITVSILPPTTNSPLNESSE